MVFAVPLLTNRVAPRCTAADELLLVTVDRNRVTRRHVLSCSVTSMDEVVDLLETHSVATLVCGGISREMRSRLAARAISVIENVACSADEILAALDSGHLRSGLGFHAVGDQFRSDDRDPSELGEDHDNPVPRTDCLACPDRICLRGEDCRAGRAERDLPPPLAVRRMLEAAADISLEEERQLCRLSELVYFCLDMGYRKIGIAFCIDLHEPALILGKVLGRFFDVASVCCKIGGRTVSEVADSSSNNRITDSCIACNPLAQAEALNAADTDLNVLVGLCVGVDCVFTKASRAPVTSLFVKDKSLANNPIGAVYSEYYLRESVAAERRTGTRSPSDSRPQHEEAS